MQISFALFADAANLSQEGKLNILGVFDAVSVEQIPAIHPRATLVVRLKGDRTDAGQHTLGLRWTNPSGDELWSSAGQIDVKLPPPNVAEMDLPVIATLDLPIDSAGQYRLTVALDDDEMAAVPLSVHYSASVGFRPAPAGGLVS